MADLFDPLAGVLAPDLRAQTVSSSPLLATKAQRVPAWVQGDAASDIPGAFTAWDKLVVMGQEMPGRAILTGDRAQKLDVKNSPGSDGSTITNTGIDNGVVQVKFQFWTRVQVDAWSDAVKLLEPVPGRPRKGPIDVYHPSLAIAHVKSLVVKNVGFLQPSPSQPGVLEVTVRFMEFMPAAKGGLLTSKKSQSITDGKNVKQALPATKKRESENHP